MRRAIRSSPFIAPLQLPGLLRHPRLHVRSIVSKRTEEVAHPRDASGNEISANAEKEATYEEWLAKDKAILERHNGKNAGYEIETTQNWFLEHGHKTWGWPIYRTCYDDDKKWQTFRHKFDDLLLRTMRWHFSAEEVEARSKFLSFPTWKDRAQFEGATTAQLRAHYRKYLKSNAPFEEQGLTVTSQSPMDDAHTARVRANYRRYSDQSDHVNDQETPVLTKAERKAFLDGSYCRYEFFLFADAASIDSVVNGPYEPSLWLSEKTPWINAVEVDWPPGYDPNDPFDAPWEPERGHELIEGMDTDNVGFHRIAIETLYPGHWAMISMGNFFYSEWYKRPPGIVWQDL